LAFSLQRSQGTNRLEMHDENNQNAILVIGAGIAGLGISCGLANLGFRVHVIEKRNEFRKVGSTIGLAPNGIKAIKELVPRVFEEELSRKGIPTPNGGLMMPWWMLRDSLVEYAKKSPSIEFHMGLNVAEINEDPAGVSLRFSEDVQDLRGIMCVGADGAHSGVREILNLPSATKTSVVWRGWLNCSDIPKISPLLEGGMTPLFEFSDGGAFLTFNFNSKSPGQICWVCTSVELEQSGVSNVEQILELFSNESPEKLTSMKNLVESTPAGQITKSFQWSIDFATTGWGTGKHDRIILIGDAAHAMRPTDGLGASMALEDCVVFCRHLAAAVSTKPVLSSLGEHFDAEKCKETILKVEHTRLPRVKEIHENQEERAAARLRGEIAVPWTEEFERWVFSGV